MSEVERLCDRIAIMHRGRILDSGTLDELVDRHEEQNFEELFFSLLSEHETAESNEQNLMSGNYQTTTETLATTEVVR